MDYVLPAEIVCMLISTIYINRSGFFEDNFMESVRQQCALIALTSFIFFSLFISTTWLKCTLMRLALYILYVVYALAEMLLVSD